MVGRQFPGGLLQPGRSLGHAQPLEQVRQPQHGFNILRIQPQDGLEGLDRLPGIPAHVHQEFCVELVVFRFLAFTAEGDLHQPHRPLQIPRLLRLLGLQEPVLRRPLVGGRFRRRGGLGRSSWSVRGRSTSAGRVLQRVEGLGEFPKLDFGLLLFLSQEAVRMPLLGHPVISGFDLL